MWNVSVKGFSSSEYYQYSEISCDVGVLIGVYGPSRDMKKENTSPDVTQMLMEEIRAENIDKNLRCAPVT